MHVHSLSGISVWCPLPMLEIEKVSSSKLMLSCENSTEANSSTMAGSSSCVEEEGSRSTLKVTEVRFWLGVERSFVQRDGLLLFVMKGTSLCNKLSKSCKSKGKKKKKKKTA